MATICPLYLPLPEQEDFTSKRLKDEVAMVHRSLESRDALSIDFPNELWIEIFKHLDELSLLRARLSNKRWSILGCNHAIWAALITKSPYRLLDPKYPQYQFAKYHDTVKRFHTFSLKVLKSFTDSSHGCLAGLYKMSASEDAVCLPDEEKFRLLSLKDGSELDVERNKKFRFYAGNFLYTLLDDTFELIEVKNPKNILHIPIGKNRKISHFSTCQDKANLVLEDHQVGIIDPAHKSFSLSQGTLAFGSFLGPDKAFNFDLSEKNKEYYHITDFTISLGERTDTDYIKILLATKDILIAQKYHPEPTRNYPGYDTYIAENLIAYEVDTMRAIKSYNVPLSNSAGDRDFKKACLINGLLFGLTYQGDLFAWDALSTKFQKQFHMCEEPILDIEATSTALLFRTHNNETYPPDPFEVMVKTTHLSVLELSSTL